MKRLPLYLHYGVNLMGELSISVNLEPDDFMEHTSIVQITIKEDAISKIKKHSSKYTSKEFNDMVMPGEVLNDRAKGR